MKLCIPVKNDLGLQSELEPHLPHATLLLMFDTATRQHGLVPTDADEQTVVDAVLCGSINRRLLRGLLDQGVQIFGTEAPTAEQAIAAFERGELEAVSVAAGCGQHGHHHGHDHGGGCCGNHKHDHDEAHECCGGHAHGDDHECCGGHGHEAGSCGCGNRA